MNKYVATTYGNILIAEIGVETLVDRSLSTGVLSITSRKGDIHIYMPTRAWSSKTITPA